MKKLLFLLLASISITAHADNDDFVFSQRNHTDDGQFVRIPPHPTSSGPFVFNSSTLLGEWAQYGTGLTYSGAVLSVTNPAVNADWNSVSGLSQILNKPTINTPSQSAATRSLNSAFQISTTRTSLVIYSVQLNVTASITSGQNGDVILEIASDSGFTTNVQTVSIAGLGQTYTLALAIQGVQPQTGVVMGFIPANYYVRLRTVQNTGTPTFSYRAGQEVLM